MKKVRIVSALLVLIMMVCLGVIIKITVLDNKPNNELEKIKKTAVIIDDEEENKRHIDFASIGNDDAYSWIEIEGTVIDYPVLQSNENEPEDYYLEYNIDHSKGYPGCIYTQMTSSKDYSDPVTVLYGHNMKNNTMFGSLNEEYIQSEDGVAKKNKLTIYTPNETMDYTIFCSLIYDDRLIPYYFDYFEYPSNVDDFLEDIKSTALTNGYLNEDIEVDSSDKIIVLSTCTSVDTERLLVCAVKNE